MAFVQLQFAPWDKVISLETSLEVRLYDRVVVKIDSGVDLAKIIEVSATPYPAETIDTTCEISRLAVPEDFVRDKENESDKDTVMNTTNELIKKNELDMKLIDVRRSLDGNRLTFGFVAEGRVDFRQLVKDLSKTFSRNIRLQQIGIRDEAKMVGDCGRCGRELCCREHLAKFSSVTGEMAEVQSLNLRGSDRLSGACGRLMCCLSYEAEGYKKLIEKLPAIGSKITIDGRKGIVVGHHALKQTIDVEFDGDGDGGKYVLEVDLNSNKAKDKKK